MKLAKVYEPNQYEPTIYAMWEASNVFNARGEGEPFSIIMPPPNANGDLHVGHAYGTAIQDILTRYYRMKGYDTVYIPGADHAGLETWVVYERELNKQGKTRSDFSREELYAQVWDFVEKNRGGMDLQLRALGASASWDNLVFTLDQKVIDTVYATFKKLWDDGLVYRGERMVNYSTAYQTSYADIEVDYKKVKGTLWNIAYRLTDGSGELVVATTRPETLLGDTAVAVHPEDERYKEMVGKTVVVPIVNREVPIIADEAVDKSFGTGVVKVTPAHDPNDFEIGKRHNLARIQVIGFDGKMTSDSKYYAGFEIDEARKRVLAALQADDLRRGEKTIEHSVGFDYKSGLPIQPLVKEQWFIKTKPLADKAKEVIESGRISFYPKGKSRLLLQYYDAIHDWNISRQIPWGIPIPAFQNTADPKDWIFDTRVNHPTIEIDGKTYKREEDVFDTWFSSGQWPFITTNYGENGELSKFYPTTVMETGADILFPWVSRMIMLGLYVTEDIPFKDVFLHGLILDEHSKKMSKSKGNVINPMEMIAQYGSDALRIGIVSSRSPGQDQAFTSDKIIAGRNFCNKLWNIARYIESKTNNQKVTPVCSPKSLADHWIVHELSEASQTLQEHLKSYRFSEAVELIYHTIWNSVADWYLEASKLDENIPHMTWVLEMCLKLTHPFAPFVTETIWQTLDCYETMLIEQNWPELSSSHEIAAAEFVQLQEFVTEARFIAKELGGRQSVIYGNDSLIDENKSLIQHLVKLENIEQEQGIVSGIRLAVPGREAWMKVDQQTLKKHRKKLEVRIHKVEEAVIQLEKRLSNDSYINNAPTHLVEETRTQLEEQHKLAIRLTNELELIND